MQNKYDKLLVNIAWPQISMDKDNLGQYLTRDFLRAPLPPNSMLGPRTQATKKSDPGLSINIEFEGGGGRNKCNGKSLVKY